MPDTYVYARANQRMCSTNVYSLDLQFTVFVCALVWYGLCMRSKSNAHTLPQSLLLSEIYRSRFIIVEHLYVQQIYVNKAQFFFLFIFHKMMKEYSNYRIGIWITPQAIITFAWRIVRVPLSCGCAASWSFARYKHNHQNHPPQPFIP